MFLMCMLHSFIIFQSGLVAVGTHKGLVQIWDAGAQKRVSTIEGHTARVGRENKDLLIIDSNSNYCVIVVKKKIVKMMMLLYLQIVNLLFYSTPHQ